MRISARADYTLRLSHEFLCPFKAGKQLISGLLEQNRGFFALFGVRHATGPRSKSER